MSALIFDVDGTLAETEEAHRDAFNEAFAQAGLVWHWDQYRYEELLKVSGGKERIRHFVESEGIAVGEPLDDLVRRLHATKTRIYTAMALRGAIELRRGVVELIAAAKARGIRLAIATTTSRPNVDALLAVTLGGTDDFEAIACGDMVEHKKPAPDVYTLCLEMLGLPSSLGLALEDSENGLSAAKAAGLRCVVTPALYTRNEEFAGADLLLDDLTDVRRIIALLD